MSQSIDPRFKVAYVLSLKRVETTILLTIASLCLSFGFFVGDGSNLNYALLYDFAHPYVWASMFLAYGSVKLFGLFDYISYHVKVINGCIGLWMWNYIFLSFAIFDTTTMAPTEALLLVPVISEVWILISAVHCARK